jgi:hypothetical protein
MARARMSFDPPAENGTTMVMCFEESGYSAAERRDRRIAFCAEQIVTLLRQIEVLMAQGKSPPEACRAAIRGYSELVESYIAVLNLPFSGADIAFEFSLTFDAIAG